MTRRGLGMLLVLAAFAAPPLAAQQQAQDDRINQLEQKLNELLRQAEEIRQELKQLKPAPATTEAAPAQEEDLTKIDVATPPAQAQTQPATTPAPANTTQEPNAAPALTDVQTVENASNPGAAKALNPDLSVIGTFLGHAGDVNPLEERAPFDVDEVELAAEAAIDPYAKGRFFLSINRQGIDVEEGYALFTALPWGLSAKVGKTKATFGKANTWHTHVRPWVDEPLMITRFFGDEGLNDVGISVSRAIPNPWNTYLEVTGEVYSGDVEGVFGRTAQNDLFYNAHVKAFRDLSENSNLEVGASYATGTLPQISDVAIQGHNRFTGVDVTYRWKPLMRSIYNSLIVRFEGLANERADASDTLYGYYASADYQLAQRWFAGVRFDRSDRLAAIGLDTDHAISGTISFWPSEFSQLRAQLRRTMLGDHGPSYNELLLQLQFAIGAHGAHTF
ncbi:MAG: hypothetical protein JO197_20715 [Acidobacteria bacterium]|nr:hypothetical protein [Acidobacteriota bacterium]MBV9476987.1 hypothetical protein [Acidobacteriota bacterium]